MDKAFGADPALVASQSSQSSLSRPSGFDPGDVRLSDNERAVLLGMWSEHSSEFDDFCGDGAGWFFPFKSIAAVTPAVHPSLIRRTVRALARKGLTGFSNGLCSDDGTFLGAGYGLTRAGRLTAQAIEARRVETAKQGSIVDESAVGATSADAPSPGRDQ
jgi:hypothetical protein